MGEAEKSTDDEPAIIVGELADRCDRLMPLAKRDQFYGQADRMALGSGVIVGKVKVPVWLPDAEAYGTGATTALILTHECDIDPENVRPFSDKALIAPLQGLAKLTDVLTSKLGVAETISLVNNVASGKTTRLFYLPRLGGEEHPLHFGAIIDFNYVASCGVQALAKCEKICALTGYGLTAIDRALQNHLFRPKADPIPGPWG